MADLRWVAPGDLMRVWVSAATFRQYRGLDPPRRNIGFSSGASPTLHNGFTYRVAGEVYVSVVGRVLTHHDGTSGLAVGQAPPYTMVLHIVYRRINRRTPLRPSPRRRGIPVFFRCSQRSSARGGCAVRRGERWCRRGLRPSGSWRLSRCR